MLDNVAVDGLSAAVEQQVGTRAFGRWWVMIEEGDAFCFCLWRQDADTRCRFLREIDEFAGGERCAG